MKILRVGDKVRTVRNVGCLATKGTIDIVQEAQYEYNGDDMYYALFHSGAWFHNKDLEFVSSDGGKTLRKLIKEEEDE